MRSELASLTGRRNWRAPTREGRRRTRPARGGGGLPRPWRDGGGGGLPRPWRDGGLPRPWRDGSDPIPTLRANLPPRRGGATIPYIYKGIVRSHSKKFRTKFLRQGDRREYQRPLRVVLHDPIQNK